LVTCNGFSFSFSMCEEVSREFCRQLAKVELHAHLNGSIPMNTLLELSKEQGKENLTDSSFLLGNRGDRSLEECFKLFDVVYQLTKDDDTIYRITKDVIKSFADDNVKYLELRTTPKVNPATNRTKDSYIQAVLRGTRECNHDNSLDIQTRILISIDRRLPLSDAEEAVDLALKYKDQGVVGLDWCGNPEIGSFSTFLPAFKRGREQGLKITLHFAEVDEPENVQDILKFRPDRIGHATVLCDDAVSQLHDNPIPMEICFTSNLLCQTVTEGTKHHFGVFHPLDYPLAICTDDKGVFGSDLSDEYYLIAQAFNLTQQQVITLANSAHSLIFDTNCPVPSN